MKLQSYITGCYGALTSFNVLFAEADDQFRGGGGGSACRRTAETAETEVYHETTPCRAHRVRQRPRSGSLTARDEADGAEDLVRLKDRALSATAEGVTIADAHLKDQPIIYANAGFERLTGYPQDFVVGRNCRFLQGPETDQDTVDAIRRAVRKASRARWRSSTTARTERHSGIVCRSRRSGPLVAR